jgi:hypothetical protein
MEKDKTATNQLNNKIKTIEVDRKGLLSFSFPSFDVFVGSPCSADDAT